MSQLPENKFMWQVYILRCSDDSYYTGCTSNMFDRLDRHNKGEIRYTSSRLPVDLIVTINFNNKYKAYDFERYLKSGSGRAFMNKRLV
jgi:putative endonuclease